MNPERVIRRPPLAYAVLTLLALGTLGCARSLQIGARIRHLAPPSQPSFDTYQLVTGEDDARPPCAIVFYVPGSADTSVTRAIGPMAGFVLMNMRVVLVERRGVEGERVDPLALSWSTKPRRVADLRLALDVHLAGVDPKLPVLLVGASEGGDVAASVAADNPRVTHLLLLGTGGGMTQAEELALLVRRQPNYLGVGSEAALQSQFAAIQQRPHSTETWLGLPYSRWSSFLWVRALEDLVRFRGHALLVHGERDDSVPVESARALHTALAKRGSQRFRYVEAAGMDHHFRDPSGRAMFPVVEVDVLRWMRDTGLLSSRDAERFIARSMKNHPEWFPPK